MRKLPFFALIILTVCVSGCSFRTDLVVINLSDKAIEVRYRIKDFPGPFSPPTPPATKTAAQMDDDSQWLELAANQYLVDSHSRTITATLLPHTALLVDRVRGPGIPSENDSALYFRINEIMIRGASGMIMLQGDQVRTAFAPESKQVYSITYK
jgi:hypothetical protein